MSYKHTQRGPLGWILLSVALGPAALAAGLAPPSGIALLMMFLAGLFLLLAASFWYLTVEDLGDRLSVRYGPLPLLGTSVVYSTISAARVGQSHWIDGLGVHYVPGRGWTYNVWGRDCVDIQRGSSTVRIGTNDAARLAEFLNTKINFSHPGTRTA